LAGSPISIAPDAFANRRQREEVAGAMQLTVTGKQIEIGEALRNHVDTGLGVILAKYFKTAIEAHVVVSREAHLCRAEVSLHVGRGIIVNASAAGPDGGGAFDAAAERIAKRLRRYKRRLRAHHAGTREEEAGAEVGASERARSYVLAPLAEEAEDGAIEDGAIEDGAIEDGGWPAVVAETVTELPKLTVGEAVMRMDLADAPVLLFRNRSRGELNLVYRRPDGNIGWIEPDLDPALRAGRWGA
jgi:ribosomal subunit interface protein